MTLARGDLDFPLIELHMRFGLLAVVLITLAACSSGTSSTPSSGTPSADSPLAPAADSARAAVTLRTDAGAYQAGARVAITLENPSARQFAFNPCNRTLEREIGDGWAAVDEGNRVCTMEAWLLQPRSNRTADVTLPGGIPAGRYRLALSLAVESATPVEPVRVVSPPFTIAG